MPYLTSLRFVCNFVLGLAAYFVVTQYPQFDATLQLDFWHLVGKGISEIFQGIFRGWLYVTGGTVLLEAFWLLFISPSRIAPIKKHVFPMFVSFFASVACTVACGLFFIAIAGAILMWCEPKFLLGVAWIYSSMHVFSKIMAIHLRNLAKCQQYTNDGIAAKKKAEKQ